jgi:hypothetical protein
MSYQTCPSFPSCSCNGCPLDPGSALRGGTRVALLGEDACRATRGTRERIARAEGIDPRAVLLPHEVERDRRRAMWATLTPDQRARRTAGLQRGPATRREGGCDGVPGASAAA